MKTFSYQTKRGTEVELIVKSSSDIEIKANGKTLNSKGFIVFDFNHNPPVPALSTDFKLDGKTLNVQITEEIREYIHKLKEEEEIAKLPPKEQLQAKIRSLKNETTFTCFVDADLCTGTKWYGLTRRVEKEIWNKIKEYFMYIDTSHHSDDFDAMYGSNYKGYLTRSPEKVENILREIFDISSKLEEINIFKKELAAIEDKEKNDVAYREKMFKDDLNRLEKKYPNFDFSELKKKLDKQGLLKDNSLYSAIIVDCLLEEDESFGGVIYEPKKLVKVVSSWYANGYNYMHKQQEKGLAIVPTKDYIAVVYKPTYSPEWWNVMGYDIINGFFALFGACYIRVYKDKKDIFNLLSELGLQREKYYECSDWFIVDNKSGYRGDLYHINTLSDDYNYLETSAKVLEKYKREKRWEWEIPKKENDMPKPEEIKYIDKFKVLK